MMWRDILDKFEEYFEWDGSVPTYCQKGLKFFRKTRLLGPKQAASLAPSIADLPSLPLLRKVPVHQIQVSLD